MSFKIVITIPTYQEKDNLPILIKGISKLNIPELKVIVVDDNSPDGTGQLAEQLKKRFSFLDVIHNLNKGGLGEAYRTGFKMALSQGADAVGEMDADLSHQPEELRKLINAIQDGADITIGSRRIVGGKIIGWSWWRLFTSWAAMTAARAILGLKTKDVTSGFRLYTKNALDKITWQQVKSSGYAWQEELVFLAEQAKLKIVEVPITFVDRKYGQSKLSLKDVKEFFYTLNRLRKSK